MASSEESAVGLEHPAAAKRDLWSAFGTDTEKRQFRTTEKWSADRPGVLVVACSDGRLQFSIDHFLEAELGIRNYDRVYLPGGAGAFAHGNIEFARAETYQRDLFFLLEAHGTVELILLCHGAGENGPPQSTCAHYRRMMPEASLPRIHEQQLIDVREFLRSSQSELRKVSVSSYRAEVLEDLTVQYNEIVYP
ncbi:MAG: hypothetical protein ACLQVD_11350 [Capsulimonadaceae bacterium]